MDDLFLTPEATYHFIHDYMVNPNHDVLQRGYDFLSKFDLDWTYRDGEIVVNCEDIQLK